MAGLSLSRKAALTTLCIARERNAYVRELLNSKAGREAVASLAPEDRAYASKLALGVTATRGTLDEAINAYASKPEKIAPAVRDALRIAAYESLFLDKPAHVAVSQGVELVKSVAKNAGGLANAILRRVAENAEAFMAESDAHRYGLPQWLVDRLNDELGPEAAARFGQSCLEAAPVYVANVPMWINDKRAEAVFAEAGVEVRPCGAVPGSWEALEPAKAARCALVEENQAVVADYGAQLVAYLAAPEPGDRMLEVGSGRGTKTILLAGHLHRRHGAARIWALDVHGYKAKVAQGRLEAARVSGVLQVKGDACDLEALTVLPPLFERVLIDAPCSGTGTLRRHPEIAWSLTPEQVTSCAELQGRILAEAAGRIAPGGVLAYATCSVLREEDEAVVEAFLASEAGADYEVLLPADAAPADAVLAIDELSDRTVPGGFMRTLPEAGGCDGHFCALLRRKG